MRTKGINKDTMSFDTDAINLRILCVQKELRRTHEDLPQETLSGHNNDSLSDLQ